jgi:hypothetical protein
MIIKRVLYRQIVTYGLVLSTKFREGVMVGVVSVDSAIMAC